MEVEDIETPTTKEFKKLVQLYKDTFGRGAGAKLLQEWERRYLLRSSHVPGDSHSTAFYEGMRALVVRTKLYVERNFEEIVEATKPRKAESLFTTTLDEEEIVDGDQ